MASSKNKKLGDTVKTRYTDTNNRKIVLYNSGRKSIDGVLGDLPQARSGFRYVTGRSSGRPRQVRIGSGQDSKYDASGAYISSSPETPIQTTTQTRNQYQQNQAEYDKMMAGLATGTQTGATGTGTAVTDPTKPAVPTDSTKTGTTTTDPYAGLSLEEQKIRSQYEKDVKYATDSYTKIEKYADDATKQLIRATKDLYQTRIQKTLDTNRRTLATMNVGNLREGRSRYTPNLAQNILTDEEQRGTDRITEIEGQLMLAVAEANQARASDKADAFDRHWNRIKDLESEMKTEVANLYKTAAEQDKLIMDKEKAAREAEKAQQEKAIKMSEKVAPSLATKLAELDSVEERTAFIEEFATQNELDPDVLASEIQLYMSDKQREDLEMANISNQIYNRNRETDKKVGEDDEVNDVTKNVIAGAQPLSELEGETYNKAVTDLRELGFYSSTPPDWYVEMLQDEAGSATLSPEVVQKQWETYRMSVIG